MHRYLEWYANRHRFYRILFQAGMALGLLVFGAGFLTESGFLVFVGLFWLAGTPLLVHLAGTVEE